MLAGGTHARRESILLAFDQAVGQAGALILLAIGCVYTTATVWGAITSIILQLC